MDKKASWGGMRPGAGRKRQLEIEHRKQIANDYFERIQDRRESDLQSKPPRRKPIIKELVDEYRVTPRMITRAIAEFLTELRIFAYATKGMKRE